MATLLVDKHVKYFRRCLTLLPQAFTSYDSSHVSLVYFCVAGLDLLRYEFPDDDRHALIDWVYLHYREAGDGFRGSLSHMIENDNPYDCANLASTYFCLAILAIVRDTTQTSRLNRTKILQFVSNCQARDGSFYACYHPFLGRFGDCDTRQIYLAAVIRRLLLGNEAPDLDITKAVAYLKKTRSYDGGLSECELSESHAGLSYCAIAAEALLYDRDQVEPDDPRTVHWLLHRQISSNEDPQLWGPTSDGGCNGRVNKVADTCYSFWSGASLAIYGLLDRLTDLEAEKEFLLTQCQHKIIGGFVKVPDCPPDPFHSYLGLCALSLAGSEELKKLHASLCISEEAAKFSQLYWKENKS